MHGLLPNALFLRHDQANLHQPTKRTFTYYFSPVMPSYRVGDSTIYFDAVGKYVYDASDGRGLMTQESAALLRAFEQVERVSNFSALPGANEAADIVAYGLNKQLYANGPGNGEVHGLAPYPNNKGPEDSDITFLPPAVSGTDSGHVELIALHELGHALGLLHPLDAGLPDDSRFTIMSNQRHLGEDRDVTELQLYDVAALQMLYGRDDNYKAEATVYSYGDFIETAGRYKGRSRMYAIWDGGGNDTIDASDISSPALIDLRPGFFSSIGSATRVDVQSGATPTLANPGRLNISIAFGAYIENAIGTAQGDLIIGNILTNRLEGGDGDDVIYGEDEEGSAPGIHDSGHKVDYRQVSETGESTFPGPGADLFVADPSRQSDTLLGGAGNDYLRGGRGNDILEGGEGNDWLYGGAGNDLLVGEARGGLSFSTPGRNELYGEGGSDMLIGMSKHDKLDGGADSDYLIAREPGVVLRGGTGNDVYEASTFVIVKYDIGDGRDVANATIDLLDLSTIIKSEVSFLWDATYIGQHWGGDGEVPLWRGDLVIKIGNGSILIRDVNGTRSEDGKFIGFVYGHFYDAEKEGNHIPKIQFSDGAYEFFGSDYELQKSTYDAIRNGTASLSYGSTSAYDTAEADYQAGIGQPVTPSTAGTGEKDNLAGSPGDDMITAAAGDDLIWASAGNDNIDGGSGEDTLALFGSRSEYDISKDPDGSVLVYHYAKDASTRLVGVEKISFAADGETMKLDDLFGYYGTASTDLLTGSSFDNRMFGLDGDDVLEGLGGQDHLEGGAGADALEGGEGDDSLDGGEGDDSLAGGAGENLLDGGSGFDVAIFSGRSTDYSIFADESGVYYVYDDLSAAGDYNIISNMEALFFAADGISMRLADMLVYGTDSDDVLSGEAGSDELWGLAGNDVLVAGLLNDKLYGGEGDDLLDGGPGDDLIVGGEGFDSVLFPGSASEYLISRELDGTISVEAWYTELNTGLDILKDVERLIFADDGVPLSATDIPPIGTEGDDVITGSSRADRLFGRSGNDVITGGARDDMLDGGDGADWMAGGVGDDVYYVDNPGDVVFEAEAEGHDSVVTSVTYTLSSGVEDLYQAGDLAIDAFGNDDDNVIYGNEVGNLLSANDGNDYLNGGLGDDHLLGGGGDDILSGDGGNNILDGGPGFDVAQFRGFASEYIIWKDSDGYVWVNHADGGHGLDKLIDVESISFRDQLTIIVGDIPFS